MRWNRKAEHIIHNLPNSHWIQSVSKFLCLLLVVATLNVVQTSPASASNLGTLAIELTSPSTYDAPNHMEYGGGYIWVANSTGTFMPGAFTSRVYISKIDTDTASTIETISVGTVGAQLTSMTYGAGYLWVALMYSNKTKVARVGADGSVVESSDFCEGGTGAVAISRAVLALVCESTGILFYIDTIGFSSTTGTPLSPPITPGTPDRIGSLGNYNFSAEHSANSNFKISAIISHGNYFYFASRGTNEILALPDDDVLHILYKKIANPSSTGLEYNNSLAFTSDSNYYYILHQKTGSPVQVTRFKFSDSSTVTIDVTSSTLGKYSRSIVSDGTHVFWSNSTDGKIISIDMDTSEYTDAISVTSPRSLAFDGTKFWGVLSPQVVRFGPTSGTSSGGSGGSGGTGGSGA